MKPKLLVTGSSPPGPDELSRYADVYWLDDTGDEELDMVVPSIDSIFVQVWWPDRLTQERVSRMLRLRFVQSGMAGVNHIPFGWLGRRVVVSSNAGGFSKGVAEFALALTLAAAKRLVSLDRVVHAGFDPKDWGRLSRDILPLEGMTMGILGYGGIGSTLGRMGKALGMKVIAFSRHSAPGVRAFKGAGGLTQVLRASDAVVIALPLSKLTAGLIGARELESMKEDASLVNVARAEIVDEEALYAHLKAHPGFTYATDVWEIMDGKETYRSRFPLASLPNFIGTPHVAGASAAVTGEPAKAARKNLIRYLEGRAPGNVVDRSEYA